MNKFAFALGMLWAFAALSGCTTSETRTVSQEPSSTTGVTETVVVNEFTQTVSVTQSMTPPPPPPPPLPSKPQIDILAGAKKPCGTVAADAPKFVEPVTTKK